MILFALGFISGIAIAILVIVTLIFFKKVIESKINVIEKTISNAGPRPKGFIVEPMSQSEEVREKILSDNKKRGLDTPIKDLL